jgi:hypothetical protein
MYASEAQPQNRWRQIQRSSTSLQTPPMRGDGMHIYLLGPPGWLFLISISIGIITIRQGL